MIEIIPAIDIIEGKCVRLSQGDYSTRKIYNEDPLEVAKEFEANGIKRLHLVDLDGAKANHIVNWKVLERIATSTQLIIDFGGGLKSDKDIDVAFNSGAKMITGGSIAVKKRAIFIDWINKYGSEKIILGADVKGDDIAVAGWLENSNLNWKDFISDYVSKGIKKIISTDIKCDGMLLGPSIELYKKMLIEFPDIYLIASGGVSNIKDIEDLEKIGVPAVIFGKAIYEGCIDLKDLQRFY